MMRRGRGTVMEPINVPAYLYRIAKDRDGEVTLTLRVSKLYAQQTMQIPEETALRVRIEEETV